MDFDLAFSRQSFISPYSGAPDDELFDSWLASENTEMERTLAGEQANTGVAMVQARVRSHTSSSPPRHWAPQVSQFESIV